MSENNNWFEQFFVPVQTKLKNYDHQEGETDPQFEDDPDIIELPEAEEPKPQNADPFGWLKQWQTDLSKNPGLPFVQAPKPEKPPENKAKPPPKPPQKFDPIGTWWRRFTLSQFGLGAPSVPPQLLTDLKLVQSKTIPELNEAINDLEKYQQRLQKKANSTGKRVEQLRQERARLLQLQDKEKVPTDKPKALDKPDKPVKLDKSESDDTPLHQR